jgi:hypothetical protein
MKEDRARRRRPILVTGGGRHLRPPNTEDQTLVMREKPVAPCGASDCDQRPAARKATAALRLARPAGAAGCASRAAGRPSAAAARTPDQQISRTVVLSDCPSSRLILHRNLFQRLPLPTTDANLCDRPVGRIGEPGRLTGGGEREAAMVGRLPLRRVKRFSSATRFLRS